MSAKAFLIPLGALALIAAAPTPSTSYDSAQQGGSAAAAKPAKSERKVCRTVTETGSNARRTRLCMTKDQWRRADELQRSQF